MPAKLDENTQFSHLGEPLTNGKLYIGLKGADPIASPITIFSDRALSITLSQPQILDADGRPANKIWIPEEYSLRVDDLNDVQKLIDLDAGAIPESGTTVLTNVVGNNVITAEANPTIIAYQDKEVYIFTVVSANVTNITLYIDGVGLKNLVLTDGNGIDGGEFQTNDQIRAAYNLANDRFEWINAKTSVPSGTIVMFSGLITNIPSGWAFCNGGSGTPDLRNLFVRCSNTDFGAADNPGDTAGTNDPVAHALTEAETFPHAHNSAIDHSGNNASASVGGVGLVDATSILSSTFGGGGTHTHGVAGDNRPAYHSLVYIMKL